MRVAWIHPSWRDLVIDQLAGDDDARRHFLESCGIDGVLLALSSAGGGTGERSLPLLRTDGDWDALTERLHHLVPDLASDELRALLEALAGAPPQAGDTHQRAEAEALGERVLDWVARRCNADGRETGVDVLATWFELADQVPSPPASPQCWGSLLRNAPTPDMDLSRAEDCERLDDWLWLAEIAKLRRPSDLELVDFLGRYLPVLTALLLKPVDRARIQPILRRLDRLDVFISGFPPHMRWWARDAETAVDAPPSAPHTLLAPMVDASLIHRVLRDL